VPVAVSSVRRAKAAHANNDHWPVVIRSSRIAGDEKVNTWASIQDHVGRPAISIRIS
jgi:hypothetical protein